MIFATISGVIALVGLAEFISGRPALIISAKLNQHNLAPWQENLIWMLVFVVACVVLVVGMVLFGLNGYAESVCHPHCSRGCCKTYLGTKFSKSAHGRLSLARGVKQGIRFVSNRLFNGICILADTRPAREGTGLPFRNTLIVYACNLNQGESGR